MTTLRSEKVALPAAIDPVEIAIRQAQSDAGLMHDDLFAGKSVVAVLFAIVTMGLVLVSGTLFIALHY